MSARAYRQTARAAAVGETRRRIVLAFSDYAQTRWLDDITLEEVAARAGVTVRTVIRQFGGKHGLVAAVPDPLSPTGDTCDNMSVTDVDSAIYAILTRHEERGDATLRALAQELRHPVLSASLAAEHLAHIAAVTRLFSPWLDQLAPDARQLALDGLVVATDVYAWKRLRRDMGRTQGETRAVVSGMVKSMIQQTPMVTTAVPECGQA
jgi:AcrR family transcriptional regulator